MTKPKLIMMVLLISIAVLAAFRIAHSQKLVASPSTHSQSSQNAGSASSPMSQPAGDGGQSANEETQQKGGTVIEVNGRKIVVPPNTSYSQTFHDPGSQTSVSVNSSQHSSQSGSGGSSASSSSSSSIEVNTQQP